MLSMFPKEIDRLPRPTIEALLTYVRKNPGFCDDPLFALVMASFEHKLVNDYSNDLCRQIGRYLVRRGLVTCRRIRIGRSMYKGDSYQLTPKGDRYLDRRWFIWLVWDEVKDFMARVVAHKMEP